MQEVARDLSKQWSGMAFLNVAIVKGGFSVGALPSVLMLTLPLVMPGSHGLALGMNAIFFLPQSEDPFFVCKFDREALPAVQSNKEVPGTKKIEFLVPDKGEED